MAVKTLYNIQGPNYVGSTYRADYAAEMILRNAGVDEANTQKRVKDELADWDLRKRHTESVTAVQCGQNTYTIKKTFKEFFPNIISTRQNA